LIRASKPVFSGALDHRVNCLDIVKVKSYLGLQKTEKADLSKDDQTLMTKLVELDNQLYNGTIRHGIWHQDYRLATGSLPSSVEGAQACTIGTRCFIFGGFARTMYNELRCFNT
jgi:hypothetical protein